MEPLGNLTVIDRRKLELLSKEDHRFKVKFLSWTRSSYFHSLAVNTLFQCADDSYTFSRRMTADGYLENAQDRVREP